MKRPTEEFLTEAVDRFFDYITAIMMVAVVVSVVGFFIYVLYTTFMDFGWPVLLVPGFVVALFGVACLAVWTQGRRSA